MQPNKLSMPPEWAPHERTWLAWPWDESLWQENTQLAQAEWASFAAKLLEFEPISILVPDRAQYEAVVSHHIAERAKGRSLHTLSFIEASYGDIWIRDTGPLFVQDASGKKTALEFRFNGWGEKYLLPGDATVARHMTRHSDFSPYEESVVLEGGALEWNGRGVVITTQDCVLNPNRGSFASKASFELWAYERFGIEHVVWLERGLLLDHTDGHVDNLARFVREDLVLIAQPSAASDPNATILEEIENQIRPQLDRLGIKLGMVPSPGAVLNEASKEVMPASYLNFYLSEKLCIVPGFGAPSDQEAVRVISKYLGPSFCVFQSPARAILTGGGAFHCMTQQEPRFMED